MFDHILSQQADGSFSCTCGKTYKNSHSHSVANTKRGETTAYRYLVGGELQSPVAALTSWISGSM